MKNRLIYVIAHIVSGSILFPLGCIGALFIPITAIIGIFGFIIKGDFGYTKHCESWLDFVVMPVILPFMWDVEISTYLDDKLLNIKSKNVTFYKGYKAGYRKAKQK